MDDTLQVGDLGAGIDYAAATDLQERWHAARRERRCPDTLLLLEHTPVYTLGRSADRSHVLLSPTELAAAGVQLAATSRGGDVTYHGPGQLVGYPIIHLGARHLGVLDYVTALEEVLIRAVSACGIAGAARDARNRGVWVGNDKLAAIGIRVSRQVSAHGFALNVNTRLEDYRGIVACGIASAGVTTMARLLGHPVDMDRVKAAVVDAFQAVLGYARCNWLEAGAKTDL